MGATLVALLFGFSIVIIRGEVVPPRFSYDGLNIQRAAQGSVGILDSSFTNVGAVYKYLGVANNEVAAGLIGFSLAAVAIFIAVAKRQDSGSLTPSKVFVLAITVVFSAVYLGYYSKDAFVSVIVIVLLLARAGLAGDIAIIATLGIYATFFRTYWWLVLAIYVAMRIRTRYQMSTSRLFFLGIAASVAIGLYIFVVRDTPPDYYRFAVNDLRFGSADATTAITPFVTAPEPLGGIVNNLLTLCSLIAPVPLALVGGAYYIALAAIIGLMWFIAGTSARRLLRTQQCTLISRSVILVAALLVVQSVFEPDYGSAIRHLTPLLPLVLLVCWSSGKPQYLPPNRTSDSCRPKTSLGSSTTTH